MGKRILSLFEEADKLGGLVARMRLASTAQITSTEAAASEDKPEIIARLQKALDSLRGEFEPGPRTESSAGAIAPAKSGDPQTRVLRRHLRTYVDLMAQRSLFVGDLQSTVRRINEAASTTLSIQRVSIWFLDDARQKITCADLFDRGTGQYSAGTELFAKDFAPYFKALQTERTIAANDAHSDPRTSCFSTVYLKPLGINSLLDVPIWLDKKMVGVVCHEHVGPARVWDSDEETFAYLM
ncbi:MAG TPA: GAF domain-containing protein, partial [Polyangiales bacterium]|nr:GAF domain-containing protein [Polyangiales bacterium]